jgi:hypothetical protein
MIDATELDDLAGVTEHPGWSRIKGRLAQEWGPAGKRFQARIEQVANATDAAEAARAMQLVIMVRKEIETFITSIEGRVAHLQAQKNHKPSMSRRGTL